MKVCIVCYEDVNAWILGKFAKKLQDNLRLLGVEACISKRPDLLADINHHIIYYNYNGEHSTIDTVMITHIDTDQKLELISKQLQVAEMGICMSSDTVNKLAAKGILRNKLCHILPAHDEIFKPRPLQIGITSRIYNDGRKREYLLTQLSDKISPDDFAFKIMGAGWDNIVCTLRIKGFKVEYFEKFDYEQYKHLVPTFDYFLYLGLDEGAMGFIDALAAGVPTIVTPQGYHLDATISHSFVTLDELVAVFKGISQKRQSLVSSVSEWTWQKYAEKHLSIWRSLINKSALNLTSQLPGISDCGAVVNEHKDEEIKVLIFYDEPGWAWWHRAHNIKQHISVQFKIDILQITDSFDHKQYDLILCFESYLYKKISHVPQHKVILGSSTLKSLPSAFEVYSKGCFAGFVVNNIEAYSHIKHLPNVFCCQNGVNEELFYFKYPRTDKLTACWIGNNKSMNNKGVDIIKESCERAGTNLHLIDQSDNVYKGNLLTQEQLRDQIYHQASFYICASEMEGTPNPALESLACGLPVISTCVGNMPEIIIDGYNGYLVERNSLSIADAIEKIKSSDLKQMSYNARKSILDGWTWKQQAEKYEQMFLKIVDKNTNTQNFNQSLYFFNLAQQTLSQRNFDHAYEYIQKYRATVDYSKLPIVDNRSSKTPHISVIIVAYKTNLELLKCVQSLFKCRGDDYEVIIVDNGGNEAVKDVLCNFPLLYISNPDNLILSEGRNIGVAFARSEIAAFLDDDALVDTNYVQAIRDIFAVPEICAVRGKVIPKTTDAHQGFSHHYDLGDKAIPSFINTEGCSAWRIKEYRESEGMDPLLFGHEGTDLSYRMIQKLGRICTFYTPNLYIFHDYANTEDKKSTKEARHKLMNEYLVWKNPEVHKLGAMLTSLAKN